MSGGGPATFTVTASANGTPVTAAAGLPVNVALGAQTGGNFTLAAAAVTIANGGTPPASDSLLVGYTGKTGIGVQRTATTSLTLSEGDSTIPICNNDVVVPVTAKTIVSRGPPPPPL